MKFGLWYAAVGPLAFPNGAVQVARAAEAAGFESLWSGDHIVIPAEYASRYPYSDNGRMAVDGPIPMAEVMTWASHIAAVTATIRVATGVLVLPQREPVLLAKQAATVACLSGGRLTLGVGAGWLAEEFEAVGADFATRGPRLDEAIEAMRTLWSTDAADFSGEHLSFRGAQLAPRPPADHIPIVIGGDSVRAARRAGRLGDGWFPAKATQATLPALAEAMAAEARAADRDPADVEVTVSDSSIWQPADAAATIAAWADRGVDRIVLSPRTLDPDKLSDQLATFGTEVIHHVSH
ncbi:MAG: LLM class F420-dependent oxidoreductase [Actinomycetota bacterium]